LDDFRKVCATQKMNSQKVDFARNSQIAQVLKSKNTLKMFFKTFRNHFAKQKNSSFVKQFKFLNKISNQQISENIL